MNKWLVLTAGLGSHDFEQAAQRVENSFKNFDLVARVINLSYANFAFYCPATYGVYSGYLNSRTRGFGFMSWKAELCSRAISGDFGTYEGIIWIDAGCEIFDSGWTRSRFTSLLSQAREHGLVTFTLDTPESKFTKAHLFSLFPEISPTDLSPQFQTSFFIAAGPVGREVMAEWSRIVLTDPRFVDESENYDIRGEVISHRHDQSVYSLLCKRYGVRPLSQKLPAGNRGVLSKISAARSFIWISRNRTGVTLVPRILNIAGRCSLKYIARTENLGMK